MCLNISVRKKSRLETRIMKSVLIFLIAFYVVTGIGYSIQFLMQYTDRIEPDLKTPHPMSIRSYPCTAIIFLHTLTLIQRLTRTKIIYIAFRSTCTLRRTHYWRIDCACWRLPIYRLPV